MERAKKGGAAAESGGASSIEKKMNRTGFPSGSFFSRFVEVAKKLFQMFVQRMGPSGEPEWVAVVDDENDDDGSGKERRLKQRTQGEKEKLLEGIELDDLRCPDLFNSTSTSFKSKLELISRRRAPLLGLPRHAPRPAPSQELRHGPENSTGAAAAAEAERKEGKAVRARDRSRERPLVLPRGQKSLGRRRPRRLGRRLRAVPPDGDARPQSPARQRARRRGGPSLLLQVRGPRGRRGRA